MHIAFAELSLRSGWYLPTENTQHTFIIALVVVLFGQPKLQRDKCPERGKILENRNLSLHLVG